MSDLRDLYQEVILDHSKSPRNFRQPESANRKANGFNPLCGDKVDLYVHFENDILKELGFQGSGCAISMASASMLTEILAGKTLAEAKSITDSFCDMVTGEPDQNHDLEYLEGMGKLAAFSGVSEFPNRVKCATLVWHALRAALDDNEESVSTE